MCRGALAADGPHKTLCNRFVRWKGSGAFDRIFAALDADRAATGAVTIDTGPPQSAPHRGELGQKSCSPPHRPHQRRPERRL
jgi:hypothetical protein